MYLYKNEITSEIFKQNFLTVRFQFSDKQSHKGSENDLLNLRGFIRIELLILGDLPGIRCSILTWKSYFFV